ncbi:MAG TPA: amidohydrolase [Thermomicrobiales bacterium]|nr:amidohydrolase [Thermomicrobiales bacterium]
MAIQTGTDQQLAGRVAAAIERERETILHVADTIHQNPELGREEHQAAELLATTIATYGFEVERGSGGMDTAFKARKRGKSGGPVIAFLAEYDALPGLGHGCGHNLIAGSNLAAAIGLGEVIGELAGEVQLIGTPAEENYGGKVTMIRNGAFDDVDVALSSHHGGHRTGVAVAFPEGTCLAVTPRIFRYHGKTAHAAMDPHKGINALNAVIHLFTGIDALRQHVTPDVRIHGIITHGGEAPNVVPDFAEAHFLIRGASRAIVNDVIAKVEKIAEGAALMTGARLEIDDTAEEYDDMLPSYRLGNVLRGKFDTAGLVEHPPRSEQPPQAGPAPYSTDLGNVSKVVPTSMVSFAISDVPINGHSQDVVDGSISSFGREQALKTGTVLALGALDVLTQPDLVAALKAEFAAANGA